jgi:YidC/Oxa1 family membrane protein insertase
MNDIRRTILWVIFGFSMVMLWDQWQVHNGKKATFFPSSSQQTTPVAGGVPAVTPGASNAGVPSVASAQRAH